MPAWAILARRLGAALIIVGMLPAAMPVAMARIDVRFEDVRNSTGMIRACLTQNPAFFPHCDKDPAARKLSVPAAPGAALSFVDIAPGEYAIAALHDENGDGRMNMRLGIPREGVGFSRSPRLRFSAPSFAQVRFAVGAAAVRQDIHLQYFL